MADVQTTDSHLVPVHPARFLGRIALGICLGVALLPAAVELIAIAGSISAFKYQGF